MKKYLFLGVIFLLGILHISAYGEVSKEISLVTPDETALEIYKIKNVKIENISDDIVTGKQKAIDDGKKAAFDDLIKRFISYGYISVAPNPSFEKIDDAIKSLFVIEELVLDNKYEARMNYEFEPAKILKILNLESIGVLPKKEQYLLVPVLNEKGKITPWYPVWVDAWRQFKIDSIVFPLGDLEDIKTINSEDLSKLNYTGFDVLARRYKIPVVIMAEAKYNVPKNVLTVTLFRFETEPKEVAKYRYPGSFGIGSKELFITAANDIINSLKKNGVPRNGTALKNPLAEQEIDIQYNRDYQSEKNSSQRTLVASVITRSLSDWSAMRRKLINCKLINDISVNAFSATQTDVNIYHIGEIEELQRSLAGNGLDLIKKDETYIIDRVK